MAEKPNAPAPARFTPVIHQASDLGRQAAQPWHTSNQASALATRKQTEPKTSGRQTWCRACAVPTAGEMGATGEKEGAKGVVFNSGGPRGRRGGRLPVDLAGQEHEALAASGTRSPRR